MDPPRVFLIDLDVEVGDELLRADDEDDVLGAPRIRRELAPQGGRR